MDFVEILQSALSVVGGGLAVAFIMTLAAGIVAMTLVYLGSALLVLDRFARVARSGPKIGISALGVVVCVALLVTLVSIPTDSVYSWAEWRSVFGRCLGIGLIACTLFLAVARITVRTLSQLRLVIVSSALV